MKRLMGWTVLSLLSLGLVAPLGLASKSASAAQKGELKVDDRAKAFTAEGIKKAEDTFHGVTFKSATHMSVVSFAKIPDSKRADYDKVKSDPDAKKKFFSDWVKEVAKDRGAKGIFVFISREGSHIHAIDDRQTDARRGFDDADLRRLQDKVAAGFIKASKLEDKDGPEALKARDEALMDAVNFVIAELRDTSAPDSSKGAVAANKSSGTGLSIGGWICIGLSVLLGVWLIIGLIRAFTGGGGGGYGGGGYGGGGGGGFFSGLMGGMFGAMAGMYLYNQFMGSSVSDMSAGESGGGDTGNADTGAGDYGGGGDGGGTSYDSGGDGAGGDWGGDTGGGDFGGGGGDW
jgi:uncharacterized protein